jgi:hypothetical protein
MSNVGLTEVYMPLYGGSCWLLNIGALQTDRGASLPPVPQMHDLLLGCLTAHIASGHPGSGVANLLRFLNHPLK